MRGNVPVIPVALGVRGTEAAGGGPHQQAHTAHQTRTWQGDTQVGQVAARQLVQVQMRAQLQPQLGLSDAECWSNFLYYVLLISCMIKISNINCIQTVKTLKMIKKKVNIKIQLLHISKH